MSLDPLDVRKNQVLKPSPKITFSDELILKKNHINISDLEFKEKIGKGGSCNVFLGSIKREKKEEIVCIKELLDNRANNELFFNKFLKEITMLSILKHKNIVELKGSYYIKKTKRRALYITQYCPKGTLFDMIVAKRKELQDYKTKIHILKGIAKGIQHIHKKGYIHGDIKSLNVLINDDLEPLLCDFGLLQKINKKKNQNIVPSGTIKWMAPELLKEKPQIFQNSDVWSFGVIVWELFTGLRPYENHNVLEVMDLVPKGKLKLEIPQEFDPTIKSILKKTLLIDHSKRSSMDEIITDLFN